MMKAVNTIPTQVITIIIWLYADLLQQLLKNKRILFGRSVFCFFFLNVPLYYRR